jgi:hypothetical protein
MGMNGGGGTYTSPAGAPMPFTTQSGAISLWVYASLATDLGTTLAFVGRTATLPFQDSSCRVMTNASLTRRLIGRVADLDSLSFADVGGANQNHNEGAWTHAVVNFNSGSSRDIGVVPAVGNGQREYSTSATVIAVDPMDMFRVVGGTTNLWLGYVCFWNRPLSRAEIDALGAGMHPFRIIDALHCCLPLIDNGVCIKTGLVMTASAGIVHWTSFNPPVEPIGLGRTKRPPNRFPHADPAPPVLPRLHSAGYDPRNHLPAGVMLTSTEEFALMSFWESVSRGDLTAGEISDLVGAAERTPYLPTEFDTGRHSLIKVAH